MARRVDRVSRTFSEADIREALIEMHGLPPGTDVVLRVLKVDNLEARKMGVPPTYVVAEAVAEWTVVNDA